MNLSIPTLRLTNPAEGTTAAYVSVAAAGDVFRYSPPAPVRLLRWGFIATTAVADAANGLKLTCDFRPTAGSDTGRGKGATFSISAQAGYNATNQPAFFVDYSGTGTTVLPGGGSITLTAAATQLAAGKGIFHNVFPQAPTGSTISGGVISALGGQYPAIDTAFTSPGGVNTGFIIYPGQEMVIAVQATAPAAGAGIVWAELHPMPLTADNLDNAQVALGLPASIVPTPSNAGSNYTRVNS